MGEGARGQGWARPRRTGMATRVRHCTRWPVAVHRLNAKHDNQLAALIKEQSHFWFQILFLFGNKKQHLKRFALSEQNPNWRI